MTTHHAKIVTTNNRINDIFWELGSWPCWIHFLPGKEDVRGWLNDLEIEKGSPRAAFTQSYE